MMNKFLIVLFSILIISCAGEETLPKPKGYLSLQYPEKIYTKLAEERPYSFDVPKNALVKGQSKNWLKIEYPQLKASVNITYRPVNENLRELLLEAEKLVYEHTIKAENISSVKYENSSKRVFGSMNEITGNSASQVQFHVTDSTKHFLKVSLFFHVKPNYDSVLPAVSYIKKDMVRIMESLEWKE